MLRCALQKEAQAAIEANKAKWARQQEEDGLKQRHKEALAAAEAAHQKATRELKARHVAELQEALANAAAALAGFRSMV